MSFFNRISSGRRRGSFISLAMLSLSDNVTPDILTFVVTNSFQQRFTEVGYLHIAR